MDVQKRFWSKVDAKGKNDCWEWKAYKPDSGYGRFNYRGKVEYAHRMSLVLSGIEIPEGMCVCHKCDNPGCVNPDHLYIGTMKDNIEDREKRHRGNHLNRTAPRGEEHFGSKLTRKEVELIRKKYIPHVITLGMLAEMFDVSKPTIESVVYRKSWKWII